MNLRLAGGAILLAAVAAAQPAPTNAAGPAALRAAKRGAPRMNLEDGRPELSVYRGDSTAASLLRHDQVRSLSLTTADFDEDGVADLVSGHATLSGKGVLTLRRGNIDALWPYGAAHRNGDPPAFLPDAAVFTLPEAPDFLAAGDFDADGHWDIAAAHRGSNALYFLRGDGHGGFAPAQKIALPGMVTAMASGEINRRDGLTDIAVAVSGDSGASVLVFESPMGALQGNPETFTIPEAASALLIGQLDDGANGDLAIAAGRQLVIVHGRDRKLSHPASGGVTDAAVTSQGFAYRLRGLALGSFIGHRSQLAVLGDDGKVRVLQRSAIQKPVAPWVLRLPGGGFAAARPQAATDPADDWAPAGGGPEWQVRDEFALPGTAQSGGQTLLAAHVTSAHADLLVADAGAGQIHVLSRGASGDSRHLGLTASLDVVDGSAAAVLPMRLNQHPLHSLVMLHSDRAAPIVARDVPAFTFTVTNTADSGAGSLRQAITDANNAAGPAQISFNIPATDPNFNAATGAFVITPTASNNGIQNIALPDYTNIITLDGYTQPGAKPNTLSRGDNATIRIQIDGSIASGLPGTSGIAFGPVSSGSVTRGLCLTGWTNPEIEGGLAVGGVGIAGEGSGAFVEGNFSGVDPTGSTAAANYLGIFDTSGAPNTWGGTSPQARNIFSGNQSVGAAYLAATFGAGNYIVLGNYMGPDRTGANVPLASFQKEGFGSTATSFLGGTTAGAGNLISGNFTVNVDLGNDNPGLQIGNNVIQGNLIGTDLTGTQGLGATPGGVTTEASAGSQKDNTIGGTTPAARNIISGNFGDGINVGEIASGTLVQGNYIGLDITGTKALGNGGDGFHNSLTNGIPGGGNTVGGETPGAGNVISSNAGNGVEISGDLEQGTPANVIQGNFIGTDANGVNPLGNQQNGVYLNQQAGRVSIGGADGNAGNIIAFNTGAGVLIDPGPSGGGQTSVNNSVTANAIFSNGGAGIRMLSGNQSTFSRNSIYSNNQLGIDIGAAGPNANSSCQSNTSGPNKLQNAPVMTSASGPAFITATATDPSGNTSEFSNCVSAAQSAGVITLSGMLNSLSNTQYRIEFFTNTACDPSGFGQGKTFIGATSVTTGGSCTAPINASIDTTKADLSVSLSGPSAWLVGSPFSFTTYTSVVTNNGGATAHNVVFTDTLPALLAFGSVATTQGTCSNNGNAITCPIGTLMAGQTAAVTITATAIATGTVSDTASVSATESDPNPANNSITVNAPSNNPTPSISTADPSSVIAGSPTFSLNLIGVNFNSSTTLTFNGTPITITNLQTIPNNSIESPCFFAVNRGTTFCNQITATVPASLVANPGNATIVATNPAPGGGTSQISFPISGPCTVTVSPNTPQSISNSIVVMNFNITTSDTCPWSAISSVPWLVNQDSTNNVGSGSVTFISTINTGSARNGTLTIGGQAIPVQQAGGFVCSFATAPYSETFTQAGGSGTFQLIAGGNNQDVPFQQCPWTATPDSSWITVTSAASGMGSTTVKYTAAPSNGAARTGNINIGGVNFTISETGISAGSVTATGGTPQSAAVNTSFATPLQVLVKDTNGSPMSGVSVSFTAPASGASATFTGNPAVTNASGVASVMAMANATAGGPYTVTASVGSLSATFSLTNTAAPPPSITARSGTPQTTTVGTAFTTPLQVLFKNNAGTPQSGVTITFTAPNSGASATFSNSGAAVTDANGLASVTATANGLPGAYSVTASAQGVSATFSLTNVAGPPASLTAVSGTPQTTALNQPFPAALQAKLTDSFGNPLSGVTVGFAASGSGASAALSSTSAATNSQGIASVTATANGSAGSYTVTASAGSLTAPFSLTNVISTVSVQTSPAGLPFTVDGVTYTAAQNFTFTIGTQHTISVAVAVPAGAGTQQGFTGWSDGLAATHTITVTATPTTYTANFTLQYQLTTAASPSAAGTVSPATGFFNANSQVTLVASPNGGNVFNNWTGPVANPNSTNTTILMTGPLSVTANFTSVNLSVTPQPVVLQYYLGLAPSTAAVAVSVNAAVSEMFNVTVPASSQSLITVTPTQNVTTPATLTVQPAANLNLAPGTYPAQFIVNFFDVQLPVSVQLQVYPLPTFNPQPTSLTFQAQSGSTTPQTASLGLGAFSRNFTFTLSVTYGNSGDPAWLKLSIAGGNTPATFTVTADPTGLAPGTHTASIVATGTGSSGSPTTIPVTFTIAPPPPPPPSISITSMQNAASQATGAAAPNEILSAFGAFPACKSALVTVDGAPVPVFYSSATQVNFLMTPKSAAEGTAQVQISCNNLTSAMTPVTIVPAAPGIFTVTQNGQGQAAIVNQDGSLSTPTPDGTYVQVYGTGFGAYGAPGADGFTRLTGSVTATLGGVPLTVQFAGQAPGYTAGLQQINLVLPANVPAGPQPLVLKIGGAQTQAGVTLQVAASGATAEQ